MTKQLREWLFVFLDNTLNELEEKLGFYKHPTEQEIKDINSDKLNLVAFRKSLNEEKTVLSRGAKKWVSLELQEHIDNIENMDYMDDNISTADRVAILEHLDYCRQAKKIIYKWKTK